MLSIYIFVNPESWFKRNETIPIHFFRGSKILNTLKISEDEFYKMNDLGMIYEGSARQFAEVLEKEVVQDD